MLDVTSVLTVKRPVWGGVNWCPVNRCFLPSSVVPRDRLGFLLVLEGTNRVRRNFSWICLLRFLCESGWRGKNYCLTCGYSWPAFLKDPGCWRPPFWWCIVILGPWWSYSTEKKGHFPWLPSWLLRKFLRCISIYLFPSNTYEGLEGLNESPFIPHPGWFIINMENSTLCHLKPIFHFLQAVPTPKLFPQAFRNSAILECRAETKRRAHSLPGGPGRQKQSI